MPAPDPVKQGTTYFFRQEIEGDDIEQFEYQMIVKQYPDDPAQVDRILNQFDEGDVIGFLTDVETSVMDIGLWNIIIKSTDPDESLIAERRIQITKSWC